MTETKGVLKSLGIMGPALSIVVLVLNWIKPGLGLTEAEIGPIIENVAAVIGALTGIIGRWRATKIVKIGG